MQSVLLNSHMYHQWTAATRWWIVTWNGQSLDYNVVHYIKRLICSSSMMRRNSLQLLECSTASTVSVYFTLVICRLHHLYIKVPILPVWPGVGMSNGRNAYHVTLPAVCQPFSIAATCGHFRSSTFARSAIRLAICFRLPLSVTALHSCQRRLRRVSASERGQ